MNGQSGKLIGNMPVSVSKAIIAFLSIGLIVFAISYAIFFLRILPSANAEGGYLTRFSKPCLTRKNHNDWMPHPNEVSNDLILIINSWKRE